MNSLTKNDTDKIRAILGCGWQATAEDKSKQALNLMSSLNKVECIKLVETLCEEFYQSYNIQAKNPSGSGHQAEVMQAERSNFTACEIVLKNLKE